jgi:hypothetical protein
MTREVKEKTWSPEHHPEEPGIRSGVHRGQAEFEIQGFRLESIPHLMRDWNDPNRVAATFYRTIIEILSNKRW